MKIRVLLAFLLLITGPALGAPLTVETLRKAVNENDYTTLETGLDQAQAAYLDGDVSANHIRDLFIALSRSTPETVTFVAKWLAKNPDDPKAQIARAWSLHTAASFIKRTRNEASYGVSGSMYAKASELATSAYRNDPNLIPASDAMIRGLGTGPYAPHPLVALEQVLTTRSNWGSILRAINQLSRSSAQVIQKFCASVGADFPANQSTRVELRCLMTASARFPRDDLRPLIEANLWTGPDPELEVERLTYFIRHSDFVEWRTDQIDWASNLLLTHPVNQFELVALAGLARRFENILLTSHGQPTQFVDAFEHARLPLAQEYLAHDPFNLDLLKLVKDTPFRVPYKLIENADGSIAFRAIAPDRTKEESAAFRQAKQEHEFDFSQRRLTASPYNANYWRAYADLVARSNPPRTMFAGDHAYQNAVFYSADPLVELLILLHEKQRQFTLIEEVKAKPSKERAQLPEWATLSQQTNMPQQVYCPFLRAQRLFAELCTYYPATKPQCQDAALEENEVYENLLQLARNAPECAGIQNAGLDALWYTPIPFSQAIKTVGQ